MKTIRALATATLLALAAALAPAAALAEDAPALSLGDARLLVERALKNVDGRALSIRDTAGEKGTLVIFTCNSCPWVKAWQERIVALGNSYSERGIGVIAINANDPGRNAEDGFDVMQQRAQELGMRFPYVMDETSEVAKAFGARVTPEAFLFDAEGRLVYHGTIDDNAKDPSAVTQHFLRDALEALLAGREIAQKETKALGCTIKFRKEAS